MTKRGQTYGNLDRFLKEPQDQDRKKWKYATWIRRDGDAVIVRLHETDIMSYFPDDRIRLNAGNWLTQFTKARMNEFLPAPWGVYQENHVWYVWRRKMAEREEKVWTFENGAVIHPNGTVTGGGPDPKYVKSLNKAVNKYACDFIKALFAGEVPAPSAADCWFCLMGEDQSDHILSHIKEKYYVPSLLVNALMAMPVSNAAIWACQSVWQGHESDVTDWIRDVAKDQLKSALARYIRRQVGLAS